MCVGGEVRYRQQREQSSVVLRKALGMDRLTTKSKFVDRVMQG